MKYFSIAYQIIACIAVGFLAGYFLDKLTGWTFPVFKVVCSFGSVLMALYMIYKEVMGNKK
ncbi:MAG TPA: AtpZ/AtpI family protein [Chitinophagales bacterium]|nr:AtpZ/AtpI family protein [Chitinophagales bacterium]